MRRAIVSIVCGVLADRVERAVLAPAGDVGDRLAADVEADRRAARCRSRSRRAPRRARGRTARSRGRCACASSCTSVRTWRFAGPAGDDDLLGAWGRTSRRGRARGGRGSRRGSRARRRSAIKRGDQVVRGCRRSIGCGGRGRAGRAPCRAAGRSSRRRRPGRCGRRLRFSPVSSPCSSRCLTATGARMRIAFSPLRTQRLRCEERAEAGDVGRRDAAGVALDRDQHLVARGCSATGRWWRARGSSAASRRWSAARGRPARCGRGRLCGARRAPRR